ncbi:MAG: signal peptidase I [Bdellovibrionota bacterium]
MYKLLRTYGIVAVIAVAVALTIRVFIIEAYRIPSQAMKPTLEAGDLIFVAKASFGFHVPWLNTVFGKARKPQRGEVVVFSPQGEPKQNYIKRVIALGGETVQVSKGHISLNGIPLQADLAKNAVCGMETLTKNKSYQVCWEPPLIEDFGPAIVPEESVFVIGDFRSMPDEYKKRSSTWGIVPLSSLNGSALWIWLSIEPDSLEKMGGWFPRFRFERMFRRIN